jgi:hypothetical protein
MAANTTVNDLMDAITNAQAAVRVVQELLENTDLKAILAPEGTEVGYVDTRTCKTIPIKGPGGDFHPAGQACGLTFPLSIGDVINPVRNISETFRIMLAVLDRVNPNMQLPPADRE